MRRERPPWARYARAMNPLRLAPLLCALSLALPATASDKGLSAELRGSAALFCTTTLADDLQPIVDKQHQLAVAKMSQESLAQAQARMAELWRAAAKKHAVAIAAVPLTPRLSHLVDDPWLAGVAQETWADVERQCPAFAKKHGNADVILEFWRRRLPEL